MRFFIWLILSAFLVFSIEARAGTSSTAIYNTPQPDGAQADSGEKAETAAAQAAWARYKSWGTAQKAAPAPAPKRDASPALENVPDVYRAALEKPSLPTAPQKPVMAQQKSEKPAAIGFQSILQQYQDNKSRSGGMHTLKMSSPASSESAAPDTPAAPVSSGLKRMGQ